MGVEILYTRVHELFRRLLENIQDIIIIGICIVLFVLMIRSIATLVFSLFGPYDFRGVAAELIYILVLIELYRLLIIYLREHRIAVDIMIEVGIVSALREIILHGILEIDPLKIIAIAVLFTALLLLLRYGAVRVVEMETEERDGLFTEVRKTVDKYRMQNSDPPRKEPE
ncbi:MULTISPECIES: phosphate-starvation-inducible PsiE family protein [unclassified Methanoregula]|uniref:phosphate-starvation-inducible PsiE family protein n=1 Tax=unclassified Methanoregula TaxID=2649730 RepID=UPI0009C6CACA|nr:MULTISPECIES: phosphate-starvation-inducible PsiE family protein [unclassified Methanoregula]OPX63207.1 MAG: Phosphate-starvation-inducible E [Methanoregula sp. PtaB.Bin085]OPY33507.1 MAG: Phosphate-starvation-inducible E [Methanoregula sp. PtaU1.Bin006]